MAAGEAPTQERLDALDRQIAAARAATAPRPAAATVTVPTAASRNLDLLGRAHRELGPFSACVPVWGGWRLVADRSGWFFLSWMFVVFRSSGSVAVQATEIVVKAAVALLAIAIWGQTYRRRHPAPTGMAACVAGGRWKGFVVVGATQVFVAGGDQAVDPTSLRPVLGLDAADVDRSGHVRLRFTDDSILDLALVRSNSGAAVRLHDAIVVCLRGG